MTTMNILSDLISTYVGKKKKNKLQKPTLPVCSSDLSEPILVRENRLKLTVRQLFTWNNGETFNVIKMQLQPAGKPSLSVARGVHSERCPHPHDGRYYLH